MTAHDRLVEKIREKWDAERARRQDLTLRGYARKLGLSPGAFSQLLNGKRRITIRTARRISSALELGPGEASEWNELAREAGAAAAASRAAVLQYSLLNDDQFRMIAEWHHLAILSLLETEGFRSDAGWIAGRLGIGKQLAEQAIERLERLGLLRRGPDGGLSRGAPRYQTTDQQVSLPVRRANAETLELAKESLQRDGIERRDFSFMTFAIDPTVLPKAKKMIRKFQDELSKALERPGSRTEVYRLGVQLFPLTRLGSDEGAEQPPK